MTGREARSMVRDRSRIHSESERAAIAHAAALVGQTLQMLATYIEPGVPTQRLDQFAEEFIRAHGGQPAFKGYGSGPGQAGFPATLCVSIDDEVVHGIPSSRCLKKARSSRLTAASATTVATAMEPGRSLSVGFRQTKSACWQRHAKHSTPALLKPVQATRRMTSLGQFSSMSNRAVSPAFASWSGMASGQRSMRIRRYRTSYQGSCIAAGTPKCSWSKE